MWIFQNESFLSVVAHEDEDSLLHVRARVEGDIERVFPEAGVYETPYGDYRFNANLQRERVAEAMANAVRHIKYETFQESVPDPARRAVYGEVWDAMAAEEKRRLEEA
ncbi:hypothetical protein EON79_06480 [bacterium]|nr:MAG: hypothetical protein EON79_06480 [bacterium]